MFKKLLVLGLLGVLIFGFVHVMSTRTRLLLGVERSLLDGFFFLREYDVREENPLVSNELILVGYDEPSIATIGKWPWKRYVHARFLDNVEQFSPRAVLFDVLFIKPETLPSFVSQKLTAHPESRRLVETAFQDMDETFAAALEKYDNVYLDLRLMEEPRPDLPEWFQKRILFNEEILRHYSQPVKDHQSPVVFHALDPTLKAFARHSHPAVVNVLPDEDGVIRSFPLYSTCRLSDGTYRNVLTIVLALLQRYYRIPMTDVILQKDAVILRGAKVPRLEPDGFRPRTVLTDFEAIRGRIENPSPPAHYPYNQNFRRFMVNQLLIGIRTAEKIPRFPLHVLETPNHRLRILDSWEVYHAAQQAGSQKVQVIYYRKKDIEIQTPEPGFYPINYVGREKRYFMNPVTNELTAFRPIPTESYGDVYTLDDLPPVPELTPSNQIKPGYDRLALEKWFYAQCEKRSYAIYQQALNELPEETGINDEQIWDYMKRNPQEAKYFYYFYYFMAKGVAPGHLLDHPNRYAEFAGAMGQREPYFLSETQMVRALMELYRTYFERYYRKFVLTGANAIGLGDLQQTPYGTMSGVNTIANAFNTLVTQNPLIRSADIPHLDWVLLSGVCLMSTLFFGFTGIWISTAGFFLGFGGMLAGAFALFNEQSLFITTTPLLLAMAATFVGVMLFKVLTEERNRRFLKSTFSSYLAPEVIDRMYQTKTFPVLGGERVEITAFFSDIQGFSSFSEQIAPEELVQLLNEYLSAMTEILIRHGGTLDKYEGDAIVAFFGAPASMSDHALQACQVAVAMQRRLAKLREKWRRDTEPAWPVLVHDMRMRIGINTGDVVVGNMGSAIRMNYTMMGDPVNLAARLEAAGKRYGVYILVSEYTVEAEVMTQSGKTRPVKDLLAVRLIDRIVVKGRTAPVQAYELLGMKGDMTHREWALIKAFDQGMSHYFRMEWDLAMDCFKASQALEPFQHLGKTPSQVFINRCRAFQKDPPVPPGKTWDGVYRATTK